MSPPKPILTSVISHLFPSEVGQMGEVNVYVLDFFLLCCRSSNGNVKSAPATPFEDAEAKAIEACDATSPQGASPSHAFSKSDR